MTHALKMMQGLTCHKSRRVLELFIQARQEILKYDEKISLNVFFELSKIKTSVRDIGLAILFDSDTVASNFTDDLSKLSKMYKGLFMPVKCLLHQVAVTDEVETHIFEVYIGQDDSVFVGSVYDVIELARRLNIGKGYDLAIDTHQAQELLMGVDFGRDHDMILRGALQDPVTGAKGLGILAKSSNSSGGPRSGEKGVYRAVSRLEGYAPCYYKLANVKGVLALSILDKKRSGKYKWTKVGRIVGGELFIDLDEGHMRAYNLVMLDQSKTAYTHNASIPALNEINHYMANRVKQHRKARYIAL